MDRDVKRYGCTEPDCDWAVYVTKDHHEVRTWTPVDGLPEPVALYLDRGPSTLGGKRHG